MLLALLATVVVQTPEIAWIEGEKPLATNMPIVSGAPGNKERLSGESWLQVVAEADQVQKVVPVGGALVTYDFPISAAGSREVWARIGYEFARAPFEWRIDSGPWTKVSPDEVTTDAVPLADWNEVAWLKLTTTPLLMGTHKIDFRIPRNLNDKGEPQRTLFALDAVVVAPKFEPFGKFKPGQAWQSDKDRQAAQNVFQLPATGTVRPSVKLEGLWEIARHDEVAPPFDIAVPIPDLPKDPKWTAIPVPSDRNVSRPDLTLAHRIWYRTQVNVPAELAGRGFQLKFGQNNLNTTVLVNGRLCGFEKNPHVAFKIDVSNSIKPGKNEILVGIRDPWYGFSTNPKDPLKLRRMFTLPVSFTKNGFLDLAYPVWGAFQSGILDAPVLEAAGPVYANDVFVKPSVSQKELSVDVTVANPRGRPETVQLLADVVDAKTGEVAKSFALATGIANASDTKFTLTTSWENPKLWWPDEPNLYRLRLKITTSRGVDTSETSFGFREWQAKGNQFTLNGIPWNGWAELVDGRSKEEFLANYRSRGQRFFRMMGTTQNGGTRWQGMPFSEALDWCDANGLIVRRSGILDGETIGYMAVENDPALRGIYNSRIKMQLINNWKDQMVAQVKAERNHPSIHLWSLENEFLYINCINLYGDLMDEFEREVGKVGTVVGQTDPTRTWMVDGGGAAKNNSYPVHGDHYVYTNEPNDYPGLAYRDNPDGGGRGRWKYDNLRPRYAGEDFFATGINPADYAWISGEEAFGGKTSAHRGIALVQRMLTEGYRWSGNMAYTHLWLGDEGSQFGKHISNSERAAFVREYDSTFASGSKLRRTVGVFNDSRQVEPLTLKVELVSAGKSVVQKSVPVSVQPGSKAVVPVELELPKVTARWDGELAITLTGKSGVVFADKKRASILPEPIAAVLSQAKGLLVVDPKGSVSKYLRSLGVPFAEAASVATIPDTARWVLVGPDAVDEASSVQPKLAALAASGARVVVLEQSSPLRFQGLPVPIKSETNQGAFSFLERPEHLALKGLVDGDFWAWPGDISFKNAYEKPTKGAKSLVQCHARLNSSALLEVPVGPGVMLLSQLQVGTKLAETPVARHLLLNLLNYTASYKLSERPVAMVASPNSQLSFVLAEIGIATSPEPLAQAIAKPQIVVVEASPANLQALADQKPALDKFFAAGGDLVLNGLEEDGLASYNKLVGVDHVIRPFRRERTALLAPKHPLTAGLSQGDAVMMSNQRLFEWTQDMYIADDIFTAVVDTNDVAPFAKLPNDYLYNTVNGMVSADGWKYIFSFDLNNQKPEYEMEFAKSYTFREMEWVGNGFYHLVTKLELDFDGKEKLVLNVKPSSEPQILDLAGKSGKKVTLRILEWQQVPSGGQNVVGIDNIRLKVDRAPEWRGVQPLMNIGGMVRYPRGKGGITLLNFNFQANESVPENAGKKRRLFAGVLRNLEAKFSGGNLLVAGATTNQYRSVDLSKVANQYRNERGWFGDKSHTMKDLPFGAQTFANVPFDVYEFKTSPAPNCVMLGEDGVPGNLPEKVEIPIDQLASGLFFLQTARLDRRRTEPELADGKAFEFAAYVVTYADGSTVRVPIRGQLEVDDFRTEAPKPLPGAVVGWTGKDSSSGKPSTAYMMTWTNPKPAIAIRSVTLTYGPDRFGVPVLLALTLAR